MLATLLIALVQAPTIEVTLREEPGDHAVLVAAGAASLPDGAVLNLDLFFQDETESPLARELVRLRKGAFSAAFDPFPRRPRPLAGRYRLRAVYDPNFQPSPLEGVPRTAVDADFRLGSEDDGRREQEAARERLRGELRAFGALADEVRAALEDPKTDAARWPSIQDEVARRCAEIERRVYQDREYTALRLQRPVGGVESLRGTVKALARSAAEGQAGDFREGRERLRVLIEQLVGLIDDRKPAVDEVRLLADEARKNLAQALHMDGDNLLQARRKFMEAVFALNRHVPDEPRAALLAVARDAAKYFEVVSVDRPEAKRLHAEIDTRLVNLLNALPPK